MVFHWSGHNVRALASADVDDPKSGFYRAVSRFYHEGEELNPLAIRSKFPEFVRLTDRDICRVFVAINPQNEISATATVFVGPNQGGACGRVGFIESVATAKGQVSYSYGRAVVEECLQWLREIGARTAELYCENDEKIRYYSAIGFNRVGSFWRHDLPWGGSEGRQTRVDMLSSDVWTRSATDSTRCAMNWDNVDRLRVLEARDFEGNLKATCAEIIFPTALHNANHGIAQLIGFDFVFGGAVYAKAVLSNCLEHTSPLCYRLGIPCDDNNAPMKDLLVKMGFRNWQHYMRMHL